jgi:two-component system phosphate regulon response regulator PhoB
MTSTTGEDALRKACKQVDLILLDLMLPGIDGLEVAKKLQNDPKTNAIPIIILTAKTGEVDIVTGFEMGADDYITKPFSPRVLTARVKSALKRRKKLFDENPVIRIHEFEIDTGRRYFSAGGRPVNLSYTEYQIICLLARRPGWVFTRSQIVDGVRGEAYPVTERSVDVQMVSLRRKLGEFARYIETVRGVGYRFSEAFQNRGDKPLAA